MEVSHATDLLLTRGILPTLTKLSTHFRIFRAINFIFTISTVKIRSFQDS
ncbi:hypothetical protein MICCA_3390002 [Microcystis aeruginosa PCC 9432]|uniref:Transposase n=1 Tax=Microcystis aeruginosa PCC 9432 TaxID=1160280 RepID=A0A822LBG9_MICAE|nr:hypothetical protein MICCA_3390002 [Microcystis aeruginosa PCC 9432]